MDGSAVMENPSSCRRDAAGHSPNHAALATRKTCQNDEFPDIFVPLTSVKASHISPRRCDGYRAISLALLAVEPRIVESHSLGERFRIGACATARHDELIGNREPPIMAETPN
jgi:hypothetical protein